MKLITAIIKPFKLDDVKKYGSKLEEDSRKDVASRVWRKVPPKKLLRSKTPIEPATGSRTHDEQGEWMDGETGEMAGQGEQAQGTPHGDNTPTEKTDNERRATHGPPTEWRDNPARNAFYPGQRGRGGRRETLGSPHYPSKLRRQGAQRMPNALRNQRRPLGASSHWMA